MNRNNLIALSICAAAAAICLAIVLGVGGRTFASQKNPQRVTVTLEPGQKMVKTDMNGGSIEVLTRAFKQGEEPEVYRMTVYLKEAKPILVWEIKESK